MHRWGPFWSTGLDQLTRPLAQAPGIHGSWQAYPLSKNHLSSHPNINIVSIYIYSNIYISILYPLFGYFNMREIVLYSINMVSIGSLSPKKIANHPSGCASVWSLICAVMPPDDPPDSTDFHIWITLITIYPLVNVYITDWKDPPCRFHG
jgi:hypothetical protein